MLAGAAAAVLAVVGVGAVALRGGGSGQQTEAVGPSADNSAATVAALGGSEQVAPDVNAVSTETENAAVPEVTDQSTANDALRKEQAKSAAAEAKLAAMKKAQARAATLPAAPGPGRAYRLANRKTTPAAETARNRG